jgi:hypothetical protein
MTKSAYIARRLAVEPSSARRAIAECQRETFQVTLPGGSQRVTARLVLASEPETRGLSAIQLFQRRGTLWIGFWPVRVHLECTAWSETESELGLRPSNLKWPVRTERYARAGVAILQEIGEALIDGEIAATYRGTVPMEGSVRTAA